ncbi:hypothetical protein X731_00805 [Mesorhizobium sp. L2C054A000]|nr:hypothetical protein [Mesorhizobium sp. L2C054A000]ESZ53268.1 hypothetical protein X731_00805 [Mesorhizobium sp. L2C054A000]
MSRPAHPLGFKTDHLSLKQLSALVETLTTVAQVLSGLQEQPRFNGPDDGQPYNEAGEILEFLRNNIGCEIDDIREAVLQRPVSTRDEGELKFGIIVGQYDGGTDSPASVLAELAKIAGDIDWQLTREGGK